MRLSSVGLGRVCKLEPQYGSSDDPHSSEALRQLLVACRQPPELLQAVDQSLDSIAESIDALVKGACSPLVPTPRNGDSNASSPGILPIGPTAVALIANNTSGPHPGASGACTLHDPLGHEHFEHRRFVLLTRGESQGHQLTLAFRPQVYLGAEPAAAPA